MKGINHLVLVAHDLGQMRETYERLGFTLTPRAEHPFGTSNTVIQLQGGYLEPLAVTKRELIPEHTHERFSFGAFNRDYLKRHEGFSMLVLDSDNARADSAAWTSAGLRTYAPFDFSRKAVMEDGEEVEISFSLANVSHSVAPWLGLFACQHHNPDYYQQPRYLKHANGARRIADAWIVGEATDELVSYLSAVIGVQGVRRTPGRMDFETGGGTIVLAAEIAFEEAFGVASPHREDGPHWAGYTIACDRLEYLEELDLLRAGKRMVLIPHRGFGAAIGFMAADETDR